MADVMRFAPAALLGVGCLLISGLREQAKVPPRQPMKSIPFVVPAGYQARDLEVPENERRIAGMSDYVMRVFQRDSTDPGFSLYVGYYDYQVQGKSIHSPKNCLPGAGWEQLSASVVSVPVAGEAQPVPVNRYLLANKGQQALVYYWYQGRGRTEASEYAVKWNLLRDAALYGRTEEALVRIVIPLDPKAVQRDAKAAYAVADSQAVSVTQMAAPRVARALPVSPAA